MENPHIQQILNLSFALEFESNYTLDTNTQKALDALKKQLPDLSKGKEYLINWWLNNGGFWLKEFRKMIDGERYWGVNWTFKEEQLKLLQKYYMANNFILDIFESKVNVSPDMKQVISEQLIIDN